MTDKQKKIVYGAMVVIYVVAIFALYWAIQRAIPMEWKFQHERLCKYYSTEVATYAARDGVRNECLK